MNKEQELIDEVMDYFNFAKVASVMQHLQWAWAFCDDDGGIPTEASLRKEVRKQFKYCIERSKGKRKFVTGTGGFDYTVERDADGNVNLMNLKFVLSEWIAE